MMTTADKMLITLLVAHEYYYSKYEESEHSSELQWYHRGCDLTITSSRVELANTSSRVELANTSSRVELANTSSRVELANTSSTS